MTYSCETVYLFTVWRGLRRTCMALLSKPHRAYSRNVLLQVGQCVRDPPDYLRPALLSLRRLQGAVAGTGRRLGRDVEPTSRLGSLDTSERNYWVAHRSRSEPRRPDWPV